MASDDDDLPGAGGLGELFAHLEQAQELVQAAAAEVSATVVEGSAADGRIVVQLTGDLDAVSVHIDPTLVDPDDVGMLEDLVLAAIRDGLGQLAELQEGVAGAIGGASGALDIGALLGNLGSLTGLGDLSNLGNLGGDAGRGDAGRGDDGAGDDAGHSGLG